MDKAQVIFDCLLQPPFLSGSHCFQFGVYLYGPFSFQSHFNSSGIYDVPATCQTRDIIRQKVALTLRKPTV